MSERIPVPPTQRTARLSQTMSVVLEHRAPTLAILPHDVLHGVHSAWFTSAENVPSGHTEHTRSEACPPGADTRVPAGQSRYFWHTALSTTNLPLLHVCVVVVVVIVVDVVPKSIRFMSRNSAV